MRLAVHVATVALLLLVPRAAAFATPDGDLGRGPVTLMGRVDRAHPEVRYEIAAPEGIALVELKGRDADVDLVVDGGAGGLPHTGTSSGTHELVFARAARGRSLVATVRLAYGEATEFTLLALRCNAAEDGAELRPGSETVRDVFADHPDLIGLAGSPGEVVRVGLGSREQPEERGLTLMVLDRDLRIVARASTRRGGAACSVRLPAAADGPLRAAVLTTREDDGAYYEIRCEGGAQLLAFEQFIETLATTPDQRAALAALRGHPDFLRVSEYLRDMPSRSQLRYRTLSGLGARQGVERFGSYGGGQLTINPAHRDHVSNPQELMDTLLHELVHALMDLPRRPDFPLPQGAADAPHDARLAGLASMDKVDAPAALRPYLEAHYGDGASNPEHEYIDINDVAQRWIIKIIRENLERTGVGRETLVFTNEARRQGAATAAATAPRRPGGGAIGPRPPEPASPPRPAEPAQPRRGRLYKRSAAA